MTQAEQQARLARGFLATEIAGRWEKGLARLVVAISLIGGLVALPFTRMPLPALPAFIPAFEGALLAIDMITAVLLFSQFGRLRSWALLMLASGYLFDGLMIVPHALTFPGVFSETGLLDAGPQTTAWLHMLWHLGFSLFVLAYALMARREADTMAANPLRAMAGACGAVILLAGLLTLVTTAGHDLLPVVMTGSDYSLNIAKGFAPAIWIVTAAVLVVLWRRSIPTVLELWMMVVLVAWLLDIAFSSLLGSQRYDFGFYAGRIYALGAASFVLATLLFEANRLYANLGGALAIAERRSTDLDRSRQEFALVQRFEAIGQLVSGFAHEFSNALTVIGGGLELIRRDRGIADRQRRPLESALRATERGRRLIQQLAEFSGAQNLRPEVLNANEVIARLEPILVKAAGENVRVKTNLSAVLWPSRFDRTQLETALLNIIGNARDAMDGAGTVTIETRNTTVEERGFADAAPGDYVLVRVGDTGPGMPADIAERVFDPFFTTKAAGKGTGLGLSQVAAFARRARGGVRVVSQPGDGTAIEICLPKSAERAAAAEPAFALGPLRAAAGGETVLVVEDDPDVLDVAVDGLTELGYRVKTATDAQAALDILGADTEIDVLFSDVVMPGGMNGAQLAVEAQRLRPGLKVLLTSGYAASALPREHELPKTIELLPKPYEPEELANKLRRAIGSGR